MTAGPVADAAAAIEAYCADLGGITPGLARSLAEVAAGVLAGKVTPLMRGELPVRVVRVGGGYAARSLCGQVESAIFSNTTAERTAAVARATHGLPVRVTTAAGDLSPVAVVKVAMHAQSCRACQARQAAAVGGAAA